MGLGLISAFGGAGEGMMQVGKQLGDYAEKSDLQAEAAAIQKARDERLAELKKGEIGAEANAKVDVANRSPRTVPAGASEVQNGQVTVTAPEKAQPKELLDYYAANAKRLNAEAEAIRNGEKYREKGGEKPQLPKIVVEKNPETGEIYNIDQNSGAIGTIVPSQPAQAAKSHIFSPNEPAKPAQPAGIVWRLPDGRVLDNGLADLYPDIGKRTPEAAGAGAAQPAGRPPLSSFLRTAGQPAAPSPAPAAAPAPAPQAAATPEAPDVPEGKIVDNARSRVDAARAKLQSFGLRQQKQDPQGYERAKNELEEARRALDSAMAGYQGSVGLIGAARYRTR